jgi:hypothetical protein
VKFVVQNANRTASCTTRGAPASLMTPKPDEPQVALGLL